MPPTLTHAIRLASYRQHSEDRAFVVELPDRLVVPVADGAGGMGHGGAAADVVVGAARGHAHELLDVRSCIDLLARVDQIVMRTGGETTAVLLVVDGDGMSGARCGDSEAWLVRADVPGHDDR